MYTLCILSYQITDPTASTLPLCQFRLIGQISGLRATEQSMVYMLQLFPMPCSSWTIYGFICCSSSPCHVAAEQSNGLYAAAVLFPMPCSSWTIYGLYCAAVLFPMPCSSWTIYCLYCAAVLFPMPCSSWTIYGLYAAADLSFMTHSYYHILTQKLYIIHPHNYTISKHKHLFSKTSRAQ